MRGENAMRAAKPVLAELGNTPISHCLPNRKALPGAAEPPEIGGSRLLGFADR